MLGISHAKTRGREGKGTKPDHTRPAVLHGQNYYAGHQLVTAPTRHSAMKNLQPKNDPQRTEDGRPSLLRAFATSREALLSGDFMISYAPFALQLGTIPSPSQCLPQRHFVGPAGELVQDLDHRPGPPLSGVRRDILVCQSSAFVRLVPLMLALDQKSVAWLAGRRRGHPRWRHWRQADATAPR